MIDGCIVAMVVDKGLTAGWLNLVVAGWWWPYIIITWYKAKVYGCFWVVVLLWLRVFLFWFGFRYGVSWFAVKLLWAKVRLTSRMYFFD